MLGIFKVIKERLIAFIQKDNNANVRDAAVAVLATFKSKLSNNPIIEETIGVLPKYRIAEINKIIENKVSLIPDPIPTKQECF